MRILLVEDNDVLTQLLIRTLKPTYLIDTCSELEDAIYLASVGEYCIVVLDLGLPDGDGRDFCRHLRKSGNQTPIIALTARSDESSRVTTLDAGADDYLTKPFLADELRARMRALLRRQTTKRDPMLRSGSLVLDPARREVTRNDKTIPLRRKEFDLLEYLMRHQGQAIPRMRLLDQIWDYSGESVNNTVDVHIKYLRDRIDRPYGVQSIKTVHGIGYSFAAETVH